MKPLYKGIQALFKRPETNTGFKKQNMRPPEFIGRYKGQPEESNRFVFTTKRSLLITISTSNRQALGTTAN